MAPVGRRERQRVDCIRRYTTPLAGARGYQGLYSRLQRIERLLSILRVDERSSTISPAQFAFLTVSLLNFVTRLAIDSAIRTSPSRTARRGLLRPVDFLF